MTIEPDNDWYGLLTTDCVLCWVKLEVYVGTELFITVLHGTALLCTQRLSCACCALINILYRKKYEILEIFILLLMSIYIKHDLCAIRLHSWGIRHRVLDWGKHCRRCNNLRCIYSHTRPQNTFRTYLLFYRSISMEFRCYHIWLTHMSHFCVTNIYFGQ